MYNLLRPGAQRAVCAAGHAAVVTVVPELVRKFYCEMGVTLSSDVFSKFARFGPERERVEREHDARSAVGYLLGDLVPRFCDEISIRHHRDVDWTADMHQSGINLYGRESGCGARHDT